MLDLGLVTQIILKKVKKVLDKIMLDKSGWRVKLFLVKLFFYLFY